LWWLLKAWRGRWWWESAIDGGGGYWKPRETEEAKETRGSSSDGGKTMWETIVARQFLKMSPVSEDEVCDDLPCMLKEFFL
jgi:hypothetical protein